MTLADGYGEVDFYLLPFVKPGYVRKLFDEEIKGYDMAVRRLIEREEIDSARRCVILSHQFYTAGGKEPATCDSEIHYVGGVENVDAGVLAPFDYAALGHIHRAQHIGAEKYRYCGAPFPYSVSEAGEEKSVTVVELGEKGQPPVIRQIPLPPVREVKKLTGTLHEILEQAGEEVCHAFVSITSRMMWKRSSRRSVWRKNTTTSWRYGSTTRGRGSCCRTRKSSLPKCGRRRRLPCFFRR